MSEVMIEVYCSDCKSRLTTESTAFGDLAVSPCSTCTDKAYGEGFSDGEASVDCED